MTPPPLLVAAQSRGYVYLLRSLKDKNFYLGWAVDLERRLDAHNKGLNPSTKARRPFEIVSYEACSSPKLAKDRERRLKHNPNMLSCLKKRALLCTSMPVGRKEAVG